MNSAARCRLQKEPREQVKNGQTGSSDWGKNTARAPRGREREKKRARIRCENRWTRKLFPAERDHGAGGCGRLLGDGAEGGEGEKENSRGMYCMWPRGSRNAATCIVWLLQPAAAAASASRDQSRAESSSKSSTRVYSAPLLLQRSAGYSALQLLCTHLRVPCSRGPFSL